jgi:hypothetical protein
MMYKVEDIAVNTTPGIKTIELRLADKNHLVRLALEAQVRQKESELARLKWEQAKVASDAAGDTVTAKMGVPHEAKNVTIDLNDGTISYRMPGIPPDTEV